jgi:hypothetical protein
MNATAGSIIFSSFVASRSVDCKEVFRERFQRSLRSCLRRGFCVEESFGMIWMETLEDVPLDEDEQIDIYEELISWAKAVRK